MNHEVTITPWQGEAGTICMPMVKNIPEGQPGWERRTCECGQEAWLRPEAKHLLDTMPGMTAKCTECAIRGSQKRPAIIQNTPAAPKHDQGVQFGAPGMILLPPHPSKCQVCAGDHSPEEPHNPYSLYYQTKFQMEHGRKATWEDAMGHLDENAKHNIREILKEKGIDPAK
jgi:hypothetical protein